MPTQNADIMAIIKRNRIAKPIIVGDSVVTNASGVARLYLTQDGTASGDPIFRNVYGWSTDIETAVPVNSRSMASGVNYIDVTVSQFSFTGVTILGINVLGSVSSVPLAGAIVKFMVIGD